MERKKNYFNFVAQTTIDMTTRIENEDVFHLLTGRTSLNVNRFLSHNLKEAGISLTREQWSVLAVLWKIDGCTQQMLADATDRGRAGITRLIDNLERDNFVQRRADKNDRRSNLIFLTSKGKQIEQDVVKVLNDTVAAITKDISDEEIKSLREIMERINENILELEIHQES